MGTMPQSGRSPFAWADIQNRNNAQLGMQADADAQRVQDTIFGAEISRQNAIAEPVLAHKLALAKAAAQAQIMKQYPQLAARSRSSGGSGGSSSASRGTVDGPDGKVYYIPNHVFENDPTFLEKYEAVPGMLNNRGVQGFKLRTSATATPTEAVGSATNAAGRLGNFLEPTTPAATTAPVVADPALATTTPTAPAGVTNLPPSPPSPGPAKPDPYAGMKFGTDASGKRILVTPDGAEITY